MIEFKVNFPNALPPHKKRHLFPHGQKYPLTCIFLVFVGLRERTIASFSVFIYRDVKPDTSDA